MATAMCDKCGILGISDAETQESIPSDETKDTETVVYDLGNGRTTSDPEEAYTLYLKRDFGFKDGKQQDIIIEPRIYIKQRWDLQGLEDEIKNIKKNDKNVNNELKRENQEEILVTKIHSTFSKFDDKNLTVLFRWRREWCQLPNKPPEVKGDEYDVLILDGRKHVVIIIEIKGTTEIAKAKKQLEEQVDYIRNYHGQVLKGWKIVTCIGSSKKLNSCNSCSPFVLFVNEDLDFLDWWNNLQDAIGERGPWEKDDNSYMKIVGRLLGLSASAPGFNSTIAKCWQQMKEIKTGTKESLSAGAPISTEMFDYPNSKDKTGVAKTIYFLSEVQGEILRGMDEDHVVLHGPPGVGKTLLLKHKAMQMLEADQSNKIKFIIGATESVQNSFELFLKLTKEELENERLSVESAPSLREDQLIEEHREGTHIFIDECESDDAFGLLTCEKMKGTKIWIALSPVPRKPVPENHKEKLLSSFEAKNFKVVELKKNFRNTEEIKLFVKHFCSEEKWPKDTPVNQNNLPLVIVCQERSDIQTAFEIALNKYDKGPFPILVMGINEKSIKVKAPEGWKELGINEGSNLQKEDKSFLLTNHFFDHGIEATLVVYFDLLSETTESKRSAMLRAISHLIVICYEDIDQVEVGKAINRVEGLANIERFPDFPIVENLPTDRSYDVSEAISRVECLSEVSTIDHESEGLLEILKDLGLEHQMATFIQSDGNQWTCQENLKEYIMSQVETIPNEEYTARELFQHLGCNLSAPAVIKIVNDDDDDGHYTPLEKLFFFIDSSFERKCPIPDWLLRENTGKAYTMSCSRGSTEQTQKTFIPVHFDSKEGLENYLKTVQKESGEGVTSTRVFYHVTSINTMVMILESGIKLSEGKANANFSSKDGFYMTENVMSAIKFLTTGKFKNHRDHPFLACLQFKFPEDPLDVYKGLDLRNEQVEDRLRKVVSFFRNCNGFAPNAPDFDTTGLYPGFKVDLEYIFGPYCNFVGRDHSPEGVQINRNFTQLCIRGENLKTCAERNLMPEVLILPKECYPEFRDV